jgi:gliding motility-associated-like protein
VQAQPITNYTYIWQNTVTPSGVEGATITANVLNTTQFTVTAYNTPTDAFCPYNFSTTINVNVKPTLTVTPKINLTNSIKCLSDTLNFSVINTPTVIGVSYNWQPFNLYTNTNTTTAKALIQNNSYYFVTLTSLTDDLLNCPFVKRDSIYISLQDTCNKQLITETFIPQGFSPNGDGINETFIAKIANVSSAKLFIFNRWGSEVFKINSNVSTLNGAIELIWDGNYKGELMPSATYFYVIETETKSGEMKNYRGFVVLVR